MIVAFPPLVATLIAFAPVQDSVAVVAIRYEDLLLAAYADTTNGVTVWAAVTGASGMRGFNAQLDPRHVGPWSDSVRALTASIASQPEGRVSSHALPDLHGGGLFVVFDVRASGARQALLAHQADPDSGMRAVAMSTDDLEGFVEDLRALSAGARWVPPDYIRHPERPRTPAEFETPPRRIRGPGVTYPEHLRRQNRTGSAWLLYVIRTDGTVDRNSLVVLYADQPEFGVEAARTIAGSVYQPARVDGRPVPARTFQSVTFAIQRDR